MSSCIKEERNKLFVYRYVCTLKKKVVCYSEFFVLSSSEFPLAALFPSVNFGIREEAKKVLNCHKS